MAEIKLRFVVNDAKSELVNPAIPAQNLTGKLSIPCKESRSTRTPPESFNRDFVPESFELRGCGLHSLELASFNIQPKRFPAVSSENAKLTTGVQLGQKSHSHLANGKSDRNRDAPIGRVCVFLPECQNVCQGYQPANGRLSSGSIFITNGTRLSFETCL